jgi:tripartite-type tricarboxylate transporter receptor subunit TctC
MSRAVIAACAIDLLRGLALVLIAQAGPSSAYGQSVAEFYHGKTIAIVVGAAPGGTYDATARLVAKTMSEHMPGKPTMVVQSMVGAGSTRAVIHLYNTAPRDGTVIGMPSRNFAIAPYFNPQLHYDGRRFIAIGSTGPEVSVAVTWHSVPVARLEDTFTREISVGATALADDTGALALMTRNLTGAKLRLVTGYPGGNEITAAMEKGEVEGRFGWSWGSLKSRARDWLTDKKITLILQMGMARASDLPDTPLIMDYAKTAIDMQALQLLMGPQAFAWPFVAPPEVPSDRVTALRRAFDATMKDPAFIADARKIDIEVDGLSGEAMQQLMDRILSFDPPVIARALELVRPPS